MLSGVGRLIQTWPSRAVVCALVVAAVTALSCATALAATPVASYSFDEGSGTTVADSSGTSNTGTVVNTAWTASGKYGSALTFNGTNALVTVPSSSSLQLTTGMTLEAWVNPSTVSSAWRDVIYKGNDNYYLEGTSDNGSRPAGGASFTDFDNQNAYAGSALPVTRGRTSR